MGGGGGPGGTLGVQSFTGSISRGVADGGDGGYGGGGGGGYGGAIYNTATNFTVSAFTPLGGGPVPAPGSLGSLILLNLLNGNSAVGGAGGAGGGGGNNGSFTFIGTEANGPVGGNGGGGGYGGSAYGGAIYNTASHFSVLGFTALTVNPTLDFWTPIALAQGLASGAFFTIQFNLLDDNSATGGAGGGGGPGGGNGGSTLAGGNANGSNLHGGNGGYGGGGGYAFGGAIENYGDDFTVSAFSTLAGGRSPNAAVAATDDEAAATASPLVFLSLGLRSLSGNKATGGAGGAGAKGGANGGLTASLGNADGGVGGDGGDGGYGGERFGGAIDNSGDDFLEAVFSTTPWSGGGGARRSGRPEPADRPLLAVHQRDRPLRQLGHRRRRRSRAAVAGATAASA